MNIKNIIAAFFSTALLLALAGCASTQLSQESEQESQAPELGNDILLDIYEAQILRKLLNNQESAEEAITFFDTEGNEGLSALPLCGQRDLCVGNGTYTLIQHLDRYYEYNPDESEKVYIAFGMADALQADWDNLLDASFAFVQMEERRSWSRLRPTAASM